VVGIDRISKIRILTNIWHPASNHPFPQYWILRQYWTQNWTDPLPSHDAFYEGDFWWLDCKMSRVSHDSQAVLLVQPSEGFVSKCLKLILIALLVVLASPLIFQFKLVRLVVSDTVCSKNPGLSGYESKSWWVESMAALFGGGWAGWAGWAGCHCWSNNLELGLLFSRLFGGDFLGDILRLVAQRELRKGP